MPIFVFVTCVFSFLDFHVFSFCHIFLFSMFGGFHFLFFLYFDVFHFLSCPDVFHFLIFSIFHVLNDFRTGSEAPGADCQIL